MMLSVSASGRSSGHALRSALLRAVGFFSLWLILSGAEPGGLPAGAVAVIAATWTSLRSVPAGAWRLSPVPLTILGLQFFRASVAAGVDVAWRALVPRLPLRPGFVTYPVKLAHGAMRNTFCTLSSLLPGTLPAGSDERDTLIVHCLDIGEPIIAQLNDEEELLVRAMGGRRKDG